MQSNTKSNSNGTKGMSNTIKVVLSVIIEIAIIVVWLIVIAPWYNSTYISAGENIDSPQFPEVESINNPPVNDIEQYRMIYHYNGSRELIIDLLHEKGKFAVIYNGDSNFNMVLKTSDGREFKVITDQKGPFEFVHPIEIPYTGPYLIDVETEGTWSIEQR